MTSIIQTVVAVGCIVTVFFPSTILAGGMNLTGVPATSLNDALSQQSLTLCRPNLGCPTSNPVCCTSNQGFGREFCAAGGTFCCDFSDGKQMGTCPVGSTCCLASDGSRRKSCCGDTQSCQPDGTCAEDVCRRWMDSSTCVSKYCGWCCSTGTCTSLVNPSSCPSSSAVLRSQYSACPDTCNKYRGCSSCQSGLGCGWCSSTARCESVATSTCGQYSLINSNQNCSSVSSNGLGLYYTESVLNDGFPQWAIAIVCICGVTSLLILGTVAKHRRDILNRNASRSGGASPENPATPQDDDVSLPPFLGVVKYGFGSQNSLGEVEDEILELANRTPENCVVCLDKVSTVCFIPCRHLCCCVDCGLRLENDSLGKRTGNFLCPLCRAEVMSMIHCEITVQIPVSPTEPTYDGAGAAFHATKRQTSSSPILNHSPPSSPVSRMHQPSGSHANIVMGVPVESNVNI